MDARRLGIAAKFGSKVGDLISMFARCFLVGICFMGKGDETRLRQHESFLMEWFSQDWFLGYGGGLGLGLIVSCKSGQNIGKYETRVFSIEMFVSSEWACFADGMVFYTY